MQLFGRFASLMDWNDFVFVHGPTRPAVHVPHFLHNRFRLPPVVTEGLNELVIREICLQLLGVELSHHALQRNAQSERQTDQESEVPVAPGEFFASSSWLAWSILLTSRAAV